MRLRREGFGHEAARVGLPSRRNAAPIEATVAPSHVVAQEGVERCDDLSHDDLRLFSCGSEAILQDLERGIASPGDQSRHVEHAARRAASPLRLSLANRRTKPCSKMD